MSKIETKPGVPLVKKESASTSVRLGPCLLLIFLCLATYSITLRNHYIWDDDDYLTHAPTLWQQPGELWKVWTDDSARPQYYPMVFTSFMMEDYLWHREPWGYHLTNMLLQGVNACLFYILLCRLKIPGWQRGAAWLGAALFALHPIQVETVAWITERKNLMAIFFLFTTLLAFLHFSPLDNPASSKKTPSSSKAHGAWYAVALFLFMLGLLSKSVIAVWPGVWLVLVWWKRGKITWRDILGVLPFALIGIVAAMHTAYLEVHQVGAEGKDFAYGPIARILLAGRVFWFYLYKWTCPVKFSFNYFRWTVDPALWWQWLFPAAGIVLVVGLWAARKTIGRGPLAAALLYGGMLFPVLGFMNVYPFRYSFVADHFQYVASTAIAAAIGCLLAWALARWKRATQVAIVFLLAFLSLQSWSYARAFKNQETLWKDVLTKNESSFIAYNILGMIAREQNRMPEAIAYHRRVVDLRPYDGFSHANLSITLLDSGHYDEALSTALEATRLSPGDSVVWNVLGNVLLKGHRPLDARAAFEHAITGEGDIYEPLFNLGLSWANTGDFAKAEEYFRRAAKLRPDQPLVLSNLGRVLASQNKLREAIAPLQKAAELDPTNVEILSLLARVMASAPDATGEEVTNAWKMATQANALTNWRNPDYLDILAIAQLRLGMWAEASQTLQHELPLLADPTARVAVQQRIQMIQAALAGKKPVAPQALAPAPAR